MNVGNSLQHFFYPVLFQGTHTVMQCGYQHFSNTCVFLYIFLECVGGSQQFMQTHPASIARLCTVLTTNRLIQGNLPVFIAILLNPARFDFTAGCIRIGLEAPDILQFFTILYQQREFPPDWPREVFYICTVAWPDVAPESRATHQQN